MFYGYENAIAAGAWTTIKVAFGSLLVAIVLGLVMASFKSSRSSLLKCLASVYTGLARCAPDFVWLLFLYYGGQAAINHIANGFIPGAHVNIDAFTASIIILGLIYGGYLAETFRGAFLAVGPGQLEAGYAFGLKRSTVMFRILYPQMMRFALPGLSNNWLVLVKASAITSMVSLNELVFISTAAGRATHNVLFFLCISAGVYLLITTVSLWGLSWLTRHFSMGAREVTL